MSVAFWILWNIFTAGEDEEILFVVQNDPV